MDLKDRIKNKRQQLKMTLDDVAKIVGTSRQTIQKYESGIISNIPSDKIEKLAIALKTTPAYLMGWENKTADIVELILSSKEKEVIFNYRNLNEIGQKEAEKRIEELTHLDRYKKETKLDDSKTLYPMKAIALGGDTINKQFTEKEMEEIRKKKEELLGKKRY